MALKHRILALGGDYCGPEVLAEGLKVLAEVQRQYSEDVDLEIVHGLIGGTSWDAHRQSVTDEVLATANSASAVLMGAVGGPKWADLPVPVELGLGRLRRSMQAFGNIRPINFVSPALIHRSAIKEHLCRGTDITIVRELTGGMYFGPKQEPDPATLDAASDLDSYTRKEIERATRLAANLAKSHDPPLQVTSLDKANALAACGRLWRAVVTHVMKEEFPDVPLQHMLIDSAAMVITLTPTRLNGVVLTSNMFGDIISDAASAIPGSIGLLPSASLCEIPETAQRSFVRGLYEPVHGSAPDLAGKGVVNPLGMILSVAMMCRFSLGMIGAANQIELAVKEVLEAGVSTPDLGGTATTSQVGDAVVEALGKKS